jgi:hypothetical protein
MNEFSFLTEGLVHFVLYATIGISIFMISVLGTHLKFKWRVPMMAMFFAVFMGLSYISLGELLGRPKPVEIMGWERPDVEAARVIGQFFVKDQGIYLWLMYEGVSIPRYYQFPWNEEMARDLKRGEAAQRNNENQGMILKWPFQPSWEDREFPEVHEIPWPRPPAKDEQRIHQIDLDAIDV